MTRCTDRASVFALLLGEARVLPCPEPPFFFETDKRCQIIESKSRWLVALSIACHRCALAHLNEVMHQ
jgi:hypothetical protein